jgi:hypothetical protein
VPPHRTTAAFEALSDADKERVWEYYNRPIPASETRPLTPAERRRWDKDREKDRRQRKAGRPKAGNGARMISVSVDGHLLSRADAYAKGHGLTRAELIERGLELALAR